MCHPVVEHLQLYFKTDSWDQNDVTQGGCVGIWRWQHNLIGYDFIQAPLAMLLPKCSHLESIFVDFRMLRWNRACRLRRETADESPGLVKISEILDIARPLTQSALRQMTVSISSDALPGIRNFLSLDDFRDACRRLETAMLAFPTQRPAILRLQALALPPVVARSDRQQLWTTNIGERFPGLHKRGLIQVQYDGKKPTSESTLLFLWLSL